MAVLEANGINGSSLLGFLAALGALRLLNEKYSGARLWFDRVSCHARLDVKHAEQPLAIVDAVVERWHACKRDEEVFLLGIGVVKKAKKDVQTADPGEGKIAGKPQDMDPAQLQHLVQANRLNRDNLAYLSGLMCDSPKTDKNKSRVEATTLCALSGSGHQDLFVTLRDLRNLHAEAKNARVSTLSKLVQEQQIRRVFCEPWEFQDAVPREASCWMKDRKPTLRWDEGAERLHALRFADPNKDSEPFRTELGAYTLASNALACLPATPNRRGPLTVSSRSRDGGAVDFFWPLWEIPLTIRAVKPLLWSGESERDPDSAQRRGAFRLMRARRLTQGNGKLTFPPAVAVW